MAEKFYAIVCRCDGKSLKAYENLAYYQMIGRKHKQHQKKLFKK